MRYEKFRVTPPQQPPRAQPRHFVCAEITTKEKEKEKEKKKVAVCSQSPCGYTIQKIKRVSH
jgi:hypothetical protein